MIKSIPKTDEELNQNNRERFKRLRPIDDELMRAMFKDDIPLIQFILRIITGKKDLIVIEEQTQYDLKNIAGSRSVCLDILATDSEGRIFNIEFQRTDKGASPKRARYHSSAIDVEKLKKGQDFNELPITYVIFITENDVRHENRPLYIFGRCDLATGRPFGDDEFIIYINGAYHNPEDNSDIARLIHDLTCNKSDEMNFNIIADKLDLYKTNPEGVSKVGWYTEEVIEDTRKLMAYKLISDGVSFDKVAQYTDFTLEEVQEIADYISSEKEKQSGE